jgi:hypothetical protein
MPRPTDTTTETYVGLQLSVSLFNKSTNKLTD